MPQKKESYIKTVKAGISGIAISATLFHFYSAYIGFLEPREQRSIHLFFLLPLLFLLFPGFKKNGERRTSGIPGITDFILAVLAAIPCLYSYFNAFRINMRLEDVTELLPAEIILGGLMIILVIEALRRAVSEVMTLLVVIGFSYLLLCEYLPGVLHFRDIHYTEIIETMYLYNGNGMFGSITGISATMIAIFLIFGAFVEGCGTGRLFTNLGTKIAGRFTGGPAKVAVLTSALFGTMSGSSSSNVFTTGSFTIPMMKRIGYKPSFAGGVETAASVGGQSAPPIMGAGAFIMAEITGIPYTSIIYAAVIGSFCYFTMIFVTVHLESRKNNIQGINESEIPLWKDVLKDIHLLIPIALLMTLLILRFSPYYAAFYAVISTFVVSFFRKHTRISPRQFLNMLITAGKNTAPIAIACVGANMMVAVLTKTGIVVSVGTIVGNIAGSNVAIAGVIFALMTLILGMGVPTTPAYVIAAAVGAPALMAGFDIPMLAAHFFVFYFAILADATPPVSIASYAAASVAGSNPLITGLQASRLAIAGYVVGFSYLFVPELLMQGSFYSIVVNVLAIVIGLSVFAAAITGFLRSKINFILRLVLIPIGLGLALYNPAAPELRICLALVVLSVLYFWGHVAQHKKKAIFS
ncbi:MAG: TRAP transporter fused permease subunit [Desulfobacterales bacterium]|nr:TRAP transporter fused permease subunit [Desulfobacterales bacterium]